MRGASLMVPVWAGLWAPLPVPALSVTPAAVCMIPHGPRDTPALGRSQAEPWAVGGVSCPSNQPSPVCLLCSCPW